MIQRMEAQIVKSFAGVYAWRLDLWLPNAEFVSSTLISGLSLPTEEECIQDMKNNVKHLFGVEIE